MAKKESNSRPARWARACSDARDALDRMQTAASDFDAAMGDLRDLQQEYGDWRDNLPESLQSSSLADKLNEIVDNLDLEISAEDNSVSDLEAVVDQAEGAELPLGFGRD